MDNLYQTPNADLLIEPAPAAGNFFVTAENKLYLLYFATFGLYSIYWFYKHWDSQRHAMWPKSISPAARSIFQIFFTHSLCRLISARGQAQGHEPWKYASTAWAYVVLVFCSNGLSRIDSGTGAGELVLIIGSTMVPAIPLTLIQRQANLASGDATGQGNRRISPRNLLFLIPGVLLWLLILAGTLI